MDSVHHSIASPCIRNCCLNSDDVCLGCFRTLNEITLWAQADDKTRRQFANNAKNRELLYSQQTIAFNASL